MINHKSAKVFFKFLHVVTDRVIFINNSEGYFFNLVHY